MNREQFYEICRDVEKGGMAFSATLLLKHDREQRETMSRLEAALNAKPANDLVEACIAQLIESGAENYLEHPFVFTVDGEDTARPAIVTVQFKDRPSPHQLRLVAETELEGTKAQLSDAMGLLREIEASKIIFNAEKFDLAKRLVALLARPAQAEQQKSEGAQRGNDAERVAFSSWAHEKGFCLDCAFFEEGNNFEDPDTRLAYEIWMARAALSTQPTEHGGDHA